MNTLESFRLARVSVKANDIQGFISGDFQIFEINLFSPTPLYILDTNWSSKEKSVCLHEYIEKIIESMKKHPTKRRKNILFSKIWRHMILWLHNNIFVKCMKKLLHPLLNKLFLDGCSDYNTLAVRRASRSKKQARDMFEKHDIPHAKGAIFFWPFKALKFVKEHGFPVVIKPNFGGYSRGSYFPIQSYKELWKAMFWTKFWWPVSVIEQYLLGKNYRVVVVKGSIAVVMERFPPFIVGDGIQTISECIDSENQTRESMKLYPEMHPITKNRKVIQFLKKQDLTLRSILTKGERVDLFHRVSLEPGGVLADIPIETITTKNKEIFLKILDLFDANIFGLDVIMEQGIEYDFDTQKCIFLELNSRPYLKMHAFPRFGKKPDMKAVYKKLEALDIGEKDDF